MMKWFHIHRDPDHMVIGANVYYLCKCGAKRVRRAYSNLAGPVDVGWPGLRDKHGFPVDDTGWQTGCTIGNHEWERIDSDGQHWFQCKNCPVSRRCKICSDGSLM